MCGIAGIFAPTGVLTPAELADAASRMADAQALRGPDGRGVWADPAGQLALGHRRLAILDLSPAGDQPMLSHCGRFALCYNGEIYNHAELRAQIIAARAYSGRPALCWRGHSDTEILLEACVLWGPRGAVERSAGMFALALWDLRERTLTLARDRLGEKPLYYALSQGRLLFASDLHGLRAAHLSTKFLSAFFVAFLYYVSAQMLLDIKPKPSRQAPGLLGMLGTGGVIGGVSSLVGIGGGTMSVPFMTWCNVPLHSCIGTSAAIGFPIAVAGAAGYMFNSPASGLPGLAEGYAGFIYLPALAGVAAASILTAPLGAKLAHSLPVARLKKIFACLLLFMGTKMLWPLIKPWVLGLF